MMLSETTFSLADRDRYAFIKEQLDLLLPQALPRSEAVHQCALYFVEVRDGAYHKMDEKGRCEDWMQADYKVGPHQAAKYFKVAELPEGEVRGRRQRVEVMYQIAQEPAAQVREAMWALAEAERVSETALCAGRQKMRPYLKNGRQAQGIAVMRRVSIHCAREEAKKREEQKRVVRTPLERSKQGLLGEQRRLSRLLSEQEALSREDAAALWDCIKGLSRVGEALAERYGLSRTSETSAGPVQKGEEGPVSATADAGSQEATVITRPVVPEAPLPQAAPQAPPPQAAQQQQAVEPVPVPAQETPPTKARAVPPLHVPPEALPFRALFRFFHEELTPLRKQIVQETLASILCGHNPRYALSDLHRELRPFLHKGHPLKKDMAKLSALLRAEGLASRKFALSCIVAARLPECEEMLFALAQRDLPKGLGEMVRFYRDLLMGPCYS